MNRRGFLGSILALGAAPAIVRADSPDEIVRAMDWPSAKEIAQRIEATTNDTIRIRMPNAYIRRLA